LTLPPNFWTVFGLALSCAWSIFWGWRYHRQMKAWKRRAVLAEYLLRQVRADLKARDGNVSVALEAQLDDVLCDMDGPGDA
jgi:hypothetical protein